MADLFDVNVLAIKMEIVRKEGNRNVKRELEFYNLDAIIAVGYRVNSKKATKFGKDYYDELLQTIKEIRLSERRQYQKITDIFESTSIDYNKNSKDAYTFFKIVQNKLHFAITGKTSLMVK